MRLLTIIAAMLLLSCSKSKFIEPSCRWYIMLSDKYNYDSVFIRTDTLFGRAGQYAYACGSNLDSIKAFKPIMFNVCANNMLETIYYVIKY